MPDSNSQERLAFALATLTRVKAEVDAAIESIEARRWGDAPSPPGLGKHTERLMGMATPEDALLAEVQTSVAEIAVSVDDLTRRQAAQIGRLRRLTYATTAGLILDLALTAAAFGLFHSTRDAQQTADKTSAQLAQVQDRTSQGVLCPLYDLFLTSYNPKGPTATRDPAGYERSIVTIERGAATLGCRHRTRGKA